ncbi:MAG: hypothetical protein WCT31_03185 [Candidatus Micrarchaeia archaeon]|jgi:hypothetical protein
MKGYFAFVLVFISVILVLNSFENYALSANQSQAKQISIERAYQLQLNAKEAMLEAARNGALFGFEEYLLTHLEGDFNFKEAREAARKKAFEYVSKLDGWEFDPDFEVWLWCGYSTEYEIGKLKEKMLAERNVMVCPECYSLSDSECASFVNLDIGTGGDISSIWFGGNNPLNPLDDGIVGVSVYSDKLSVAGASFIPQNEKRPLYGME